MCPILGLLDQPTLTPNVFNSAFIANTKVFNAGFKCSTKKNNNNKKTLQCWVCMTNHTDTNILQFRLQCSTKKKKKNSPTLTLQVFNVGYNPTSLYILKRQMCSKLGLHDKPTLTLKFQCWLQCSTYQTQTNNDISSPFSILGSIPHHCTYMKGHVSNVGFNTDTKSLRYWFSSPLKQVFTAKFV